MASSSPPDDTTSSIPTADAPAKTTTIATQLLEDLIRSNLELVSRHTASTASTAPAPAPATAPANTNTNTNTNMPEVNLCCIRRRPQATHTTCPSCEGRGIIATTHEPDEDACTDAGSESGQCALVDVLHIVLMLGLLVWLLTSMSPLLSCARSSAFFL